MVRGEVDTEDRNPILFGVRAAVIGEHGKGFSSGAALRCGNCGGRVTQHRIQGPHKERAREWMKSMIEDGWCSKCCRYIDGREADRSRCNRIPNGPRSTCRSTWPRVPGAWCRKCVEAAGDVVG